MNGLGLDGRLMDSKALKARNQTNTDGEERALLEVVLFLFSFIDGILLCPRLRRYNWDVKQIYLPTPNATLLRRRNGAPSQSRAQVDRDQPWPIVSHDHTINGGLMVLVCLGGATITRRVYLKPLSARARVKSAATDFYAVEHRRSILFWLLRCFLLQPIESDNEQEEQEEKPIEKQFLNHTIVQSGRE